MNNPSVLTENMLSVICNNPLFLGLDTPITSDLIRSDFIAFEQFAPDKTILKSGSEVKELYLLLDGTATNFRPNFWGEEFHSERFAAGDFIGLESFMDPDSKRKLEYEYKSSLDTPTKYQRYTSILIIDIKGIMEDPNFMDATDWEYRLMRVYMGRMVALQDIVYETSQINISDKIKAFLTNQARNAESNVFCASMRRQAMANRLGAERASTCYTMTRLKEEGLFDYKTKNFELKNTK